MKKHLIFVLIIAILAMTMTQTVFAGTNSAHDNGDTCCLNSENMIGAIRPCPECGKASLYTCGGNNGTYGPDEECSFHDPCVKIYRAQYKTFALCTNCGFGNGEGGGDGFAGTHIEHEYHTYIRDTLNICIFNAQ